MERHVNFQGSKGYRSQIWISRLYDAKYCYVLKRKWTFIGSLMGKGKKNLRLLEAGKFLSYKGLKKNKKKRLQNI